MMKCPASRLLDWNRWPESVKVSHHDIYCGRAEAFIKTYLVSHVRPKSSTELDDLGSMDAGKDVAEMRAERRDLLE